MTIHLSIHMTSRQLLLRATLVFAALAVAPFGSSAQDAAKQVNEMVGTMCPQFTRQLAVRPEIELVLRARPLNLEAVCSCTQETFSADIRLKDHFKEGDLPLREKMKSEQLRAYFTLRLMHSVLVCLAPEFEATLTASAPAQ